MCGQIRFEKEQGFFISIDRLVLTTLSTARNEIKNNDDQWHSSTNAFSLSKNPGRCVISV
jgi:hypothetical protein